MLQSLFDGLMLVLQWPTFGWLLVGLFVGLWLGAVPGLGGILGLVLLLPFTFGLEPAAAFALLLGMLAVTSSSDAIASILLGVPGTAASQATILDGYPLARRGEAARALGAAFMSSAIGGFISAVTLAASLWLVLPIILAFGSPEFFLLGVLGLTMVGAVSGKSVAKGLVACLIGLIVSQVGYPPTGSVPRYTLGWQFLLDGVPLVPVVLGLFAIPELLDLTIGKGAISQVPKEQGVGMLQGIRDTLRHKWLVLRSALIGIYIGILPGLGSAIVDWVAYGSAVQSTRAKDDPHFGDGDIRGVIAPEAANGAVRGADLIPTIAIGIPGSASMAILIGAFTLHGINPGRDMLTTHIDITFSLVWTLIIANFIGAGLLMIWSRQVARIAFIDSYLIVPGVLVVVFMGAWLTVPHPGSWITLLAFGIIGVIMKRAGWPRPALALGFVLGPIMERAFVLTMQAFDWQDLLQRPVLFVLFLITLGAGFLGYRQSRANARSSAGSAVQTEGTSINPFISWVFAAVLLVGFALAFLPALEWRGLSRVFPQTIAILAIPIVLFALIGDTRRVRSAFAVAGGVGGAVQGMLASQELRRVALFLVIVFIPLLLSPIIGQKWAFVVFILTYLFAWSSYKWYWALAYAGATYLVLELFYSRLLNIHWSPSWLGF